MHAERDTQTHTTHNAYRERHTNTHNTAHTTHDTTTQHRQRENNSTQEQRHTQRLTKHALKETQDKAKCEQTVNKRVGVLFVKIIVQSFNYH